MDTISFAQVRTMLRFAEGEGLSAASLRAAIGLPRASADDPDQRIPASLVRALWREMGARIADPAFALKIARCAEPSSFGILGALLQCAATVGEALDLFVRYQRLIAEDAYWTLRRGPRALDIGFAIGAGILAEIGVAPVEMSLAALVFGLRRLSGASLVPVEASFAYPEPPYAAEYGRVFGSRIRFGARTNGVRFAAEVERLPIPSATPQLTALLERNIQERIAGLEGGREWTQKVAAAVHALWPQGNFRAEAVAAHLGCSGRTLTRRLANENATLREILDGIRLDTAQRLMKRRDVTLEEIAFFLGFSELKAFHRAFVRWTGRPPGEFRRAALAS